MSIIEPLPSTLMKTVFHADLSDAPQDEDHWVHACGKRYPLVPHTIESRAALRASAPHLGHVPDSALTHYTQVPAALPNHRVVRVHIKHTLRNTPDAKGMTGVSHVAIHIPPQGALTGLHASDDAAFQAPINYITTAQAVIFHHADLINVDPDTTDTIYGLMTGVQSISDQVNALALQMRQMGPPTESSGWATLVPYTPPASDLKGCNGTNTYYLSQTSDTIMNAAGPVMTSMMIATKNTASLEGKKWTLQPGTSTQAPESNEAERLVGGVKVFSAATIETRAVGDASWNAALANTNTVKGLAASITVTNPATQQISLTLNNTYIRYLAAYVIFYDANGKMLSVPDWTPDDAGFGYKAMTEMDIQYDSVRFLGYISPVNNIMAIPISSDPGTLTVSITFPPDAVSATIWGSGLGTGSDTYPKTPIVGGLFTGLLNLGVPTFMLGFGAAAQSYKPLYDILDSLASNSKFLAVVIVGGLSYFGAQFGISASEKKMNWGAFSTLAKLLFDKAATKLLLWVEAETAGEAAADEIPFAGWIILALNIATGIAQLAETIVEVATSDWNIANTIAVSVTTDVVIHPDPRHKAFPQIPAGDTATCTVKMMYQDSTRPTVVVTQPVPANLTAPTLTASFPNNTLGGMVKFEADFYIGTWLAAKATTGYMENNESDVTTVDMYLVQFPVPLTASSVFVHSSLLTYQNGGYQWQATATAPTATISATNTSSTGNAISQWHGLTLSQRYGMLGYAWKAAGMGITSCVSGQGGQLSAMQNVQIPGSSVANSSLFPVCGLDQQTYVLYDPYPPKFLMVNGQWQLGPDGNPLPDPADIPLGQYWVDPRKATNDQTIDGGYHLRFVHLNPPANFDLSSNLLSYGRFPFAIDSATIHPSGHVIAINTQFSKIMVTSLVTAGAADQDVPLARVYAGQAQVPDRDGLLFNPIAVSCAYDGTVLVLDATSSQNATTLARIESFDLNGNPVSRFFDGAGAPTPFLELSSTGTNTYLDIAAVGDQTMTYMYVLYYTGTGDAASDYQMAIYQYGNTSPESNPLVTTPGVAASNIAVDMWHSMYALNYAMTTDGNGNNAGPVDATTGPGGRTVPSVSEWLPPTPTNS